MTPVDDLRAHDPDPLGARQHGGLNEPGDGLGIEDGVVVQKKHEIRFGGDRIRDGLVEAAGESDTDVVPQDPALAEACTSNSFEPSAEASSTARTPTRGYVCAARAWRHSRSHSAASRTARTTRTEGTRSGGEEDAVVALMHGSRGRRA